MAGDGYLIGRPYLLPFRSVQASPLESEPFHWNTPANVAPRSCLVDLTGSPKTHVSIWEYILPGQASGPRSWANQLWQVLLTAAVVGRASRWLNKSGLWPAHVFGLEPFSWNEVNKHGCLLTDHSLVSMGWGPFEMMKCPLIFSRPLRPEVITDMP